MALWPRAQAANEGAGQLRARGTTTSPRRSTTACPSRSLIGRAAGVELIDGTRVRAEEFVVSGCNPQLTFLEPLGEEHLEPGFASRVRSLLFESEALKGLLLRQIVIPRGVVSDGDGMGGHVLQVVAGVQRAATVIAEDLGIRKWWAAA